MLDVEAKIKTIKDIDNVQIMYMDGDICKYGDVKSVTVDLDKEMLILELGSYNAITVYNICNIVGFSVILKNEDEAETNDSSDTKIFSILDQR